MEEFIFKGWQRRLPCPLWAEQVLPLCVSWSPDHHGTCAASCGCDSTGSQPNETAVPLGAGSQPKQPSLLWRQWKRTSTRPKQIWKSTPTHPMRVLKGFPAPTFLSHGAKQVFDKQLAKIIYMFKWVSSDITPQCYGTGTVLPNCPIPHQYLPKWRYGDASTNRTFSVSKEPQTAFRQQKNSAKVDLDKTP